LAISKFWTSNDVEILLRQEDHEICMVNISSIGVKVVQLPKEHAKPEGSRGNNPSVDIVFGRCSNIMASNNQLSLARKVMFDIKNKLDRDELRVT
jgi:hypothetical protein